MGERFNPLRAIRCLLLAIFASAVLEEFLQELAAFVR